MPAPWKDANVTALHKKGDERVPSNYRPVSLTLVVCKMLERIIKNHLMQYFIQNKFITSRQYGFRPGHSCETVFWMIGPLLWNRDSKWMYVIYLDLQKAFDKVPHARLLSKLNSYGITLGRVLLV